MSKAKNENEIEKVKISYVKQEKHCFKLSGVKDDEIHLHVWAGSKKDAENKVENWKKNPIIELLP